MSQTNLPPFHLAIPVDDLLTARDFYGRILQCAEGRSSDHWIDYNFYGHQLVVHQSKIQRVDAHNPVDGHDVPIPHFGLVLAWDEWERLAARIQEEGIQFVIEPYVRFEGEVGEQATMFLLDPSKNALEFKAFKNIDQLFAK